MCYLQDGGTKPVSVVERVLAVSWLVLPIGLVASTAVCGFVLWSAKAADLAYRQAVVAHGECPKSCTAAGVARCCCCCRTGTGKMLSLQPLQSATVS